MEYKLIYTDEDGDEQEVAGSLNSPEGKQELIAAVSEMVKGEFSLNLEVKK